MSWSSAGTIAQRAVRASIPTTDWRTGVLKDGNSVNQVITFSASAPLLFMLDTASGLVYLNGTVSDVATGSVSSSFSTNTRQKMHNTPLPAGFRPDRSVALMNFATGNGQPTVITLDPDGFLYWSGSASTIANRFTGDSTFYFLTLTA